MGIIPEDAIVLATLAEGLLLQYTWRYKKYRNDQYSCYRKIRENGETLITVTCESIVKMNTLFLYSVSTCKEFIFKGMVTARHITSNQCYMDMHKLKHKLATINILCCTRWTDGPSSVILAYTQLILRLNWHEALVIGILPGHMPEKNPTQMIQKNPNLPNFVNFP